MLPEVLCILFLNREITDIHKEVRGFSETHSGIKSHVLSQPFPVLYALLHSFRNCINFSNHQGKGIKQTVMGGSVMSKNNSSCHLSNVHHVPPCVICMQLLPHMILSFSGAQVRKPRLREHKDFVDIYTMLGDFPLAKW